MPDTYDHITLMCRLKAAQRRNKELESGERYIQLEELHQKEYNVYEHKIEKLKKELAETRKELTKAQKKLSGIQYSATYRVARVIGFPIRMIRKLFKKAKEQ